MDNGKNDSSGFSTGIYSVVPPAESNAVAFVGWVLMLFSRLPNGPFGKFGISSVRKSRQPTAVIMFNFPR
jgi:hypothetical protein